MKKFVMTILIVNGLIWGLLSNVKADDYSKAVIGHVIQSKVNGTNVDVNALMSYELEISSQVFNRNGVYTSSLFTCHFRRCFDRVEIRGRRKI